MDETLVRLERHGRCAHLILNRPQRHNSLVPALLEQLLGHCETLLVSSDLTTVILRAEGPSFSTGGDLAALYAHHADGGEYAATLVGLLNQCMLAITELPQVSIAAIDGQVTGGALGLALACDLMLVTPRASFTPYYVAVGFAPDGGWSALLPDRIGVQRARRIQLLNETIAAEQAVAWGLASELVAEDALTERIATLCGRLEAQHPGALAATRKRLFSPEQRARLMRDLEAERTLFLQQYRTLEAFHGMASFLGQLATDPAREGATDASQPAAQASLSETTI